MTYKKFTDNIVLRRTTVLLALILLLWLVRSVMSTILLTFIFSFLVIKAIQFVRRHFSVKPIIVVAPIYLLIFGLIGYGIIHFVPEIAKQSISLVKSVTSFYDSKSAASNADINWLMTNLKQMHVSTQIESGVSALFTYVGSITTMGITFVLSLILSFFYTSEFDELNAFGRNFLSSPLGWLFGDIKFFAEKFINTFGVVIEAQIFIALVNTAITSVTLLFMKIPNVPGLAIMVFLLSLIPVAGALISVVPLSMVAYAVGGWQSVIAIIIMIICIHALEAYVLNPRFMSSKTHLPAFFTFIVLLASEKLFGTWGLIVGLPIFTFFLDILQIKTLTKDKTQGKKKVVTNN
ncbi:membrane protein [Secundilactobacillus pentosiphilus]|uniref:Membrane protein n=1 Tax=Secundilactobacillus pentosiphilus TaxID=1714682 RepID=A0A1Z5IWY5_9LACO|nr:AI-2E family transporter [Secundilactobacillus pentosiphilus]GAX05961.1 membrane protein [Secundilactobacillus pentosiphilus]